jgi:glucokinase
MILAGDIGGTKTNLALFERADGDLRSPVAEGSFPSAQHASLETILEKFLTLHDVTVERAAFGIAGPVIDGRVETPNLPWRITELELGARLGTPRVRLVNDLVANAIGIPTLAADQLHTLNRGEPLATGNIGLISAGTGCGMAFLVRDGDRLVPVPTEGGHIDFAPRSALEIGLLEHLRKRFGRVSYERVISGPGLHNIYLYLREEQYAEEQAWLSTQIASGDPGAAISAAALGGKSQLAMKALDLFVSIYGAMAGNLALMVLATGGLYIGGGIAPKILTKLEDGAFLEAFRHKGRFTPFMETIPVHVILDPKTALYGAVRVAASL